MKATLYPRKKVRLEWFKFENVPFEINRESEVKYNVNSAQMDKLTHSTKIQYIFNNLNKDIPQTDLIILEQGLPTMYSRTPGSVAGKLASEKQIDTSLEINDLLVKVDRGKEEIKREPPEHPDPRIKEIETRTRKDLIQRKITIKNISNKRVEKLKLKYIEVKEVRYDSSIPEPDKKDLPEYIWEVSLDPDQSVSVEIKVIVEIIKTFRIEKEPIVRSQKFSP
ncbi:MAG: hypothetical protein ACTSO9_03880 [Candidatus Helarchaeota archaeon]